MPARRAAAPAVLNRSAHSRHLSSDVFVSDGKLGTIRYSWPSSAASSRLLLHDVTRISGAMCADGALSPSCARESRTCDGVRPKLPNRPQELDVRVAHRAHRRERALGIFAHRVADRVELEPDAARRVERQRSVRRTRCRPAMRQASGERFVDRSLKAPVWERRDSRVTYRS